jgi:acyl-CoA synthetase (AMP-forming)/AMP-acid ligase II
VVTGNERFSFGELANGARRIAQLLKRADLDPGDRVGLWLNNRSLYIASLFGTLLVGGVGVPLPSALSQEEFESLRRRFRFALTLTDRPVGTDSNSLPDFDISTYIQVGSYLLSTSHAASASIDVYPSSEGDKALIFLTSGSTGVPKGVVHTHRSLCASLLDLSHEPLTWLTPLALETMAGHTTMTQSLLNGHRLIVFSSFHPHRVVAAIETEEVNVVAASPTTLEFMVRSAARKPHLAFSSLRYVGVGGGMVPAQLVQAANQVFKCPIIIGYGSTELGGPALRSVFTEGESIIPSVGIRMGGTDAKVLDELGKKVPPGVIGELVCRGPSLMDGYADTDSDWPTGSWFSTGDLAVVDDQGLFRLVGRKEDVLVRGERKMYAAVLEQALEALPGITRAAVVGVPVAPWGDEVWVFITTDQAPTDADELLKTCRRALRSYYLPQAIQICSELPLTADGKVRKGELRAWASASRRPRSK